MSTGEAEAAEVKRLIAVIGEMREERERTRIRQLGNGIVDQAVGILIARSGISSVDALRQLADLAERTGRPLPDLAADLVGEALPEGARNLDVLVRLRRQVLAMDRAADDAELARLLVGEALGWSGAEAAVVAVVQSDDALALTGATGFPPRSVRQWSRIPPAMDCLLVRALRSGEPVWLDSAAPDVPPLLGESAGPAPLLLGTRVAVPLAWGRRQLGALEIAWPTGTRFDGDQRREIEAVARSAAPSLYRSTMSGSASRGPAGPAEPREQAVTSAGTWQTLVDAVTEAAVVLEPIPGGDTVPSGFRVAAANPAGAAILDLGADAVGHRLLDAAPWTAEAVTQMLAAYPTGGVVRFESPAPTIVPADRTSSLSLRATRVDDHVLLTALPFDHIRADSGRSVAFQQMGRLGTWEWDVRTRQARWSQEALLILGSHAVGGAVPLDALPSRVHPDDVVAMERFIGILTIDGRAAETEIRFLGEEGTTRHIRLSGVAVLDGMGQPVLVSGIVQDVSPLRRAETALEIARVQLTAQRSRVDAEHGVAVLLQRIILPDETLDLPPDSGLTVAARYHPASIATGVGGDWYGVFPLDDARVLLTIGDVAGHGLAAASAMAQLYHITHGLALTGMAPAAILHWLNTLTGQRPEFTVASAFCAVYDPARRLLTWSNAGHPSPVLVTSAGPAPLEAPIGTMLGASSGNTYEETETAVAPGDHLLLYTDGLTERRRQSATETTEYLLGLAAEPDADVEVYADRILAAARSDTDDDICLVVARFRRGGGPAHRGAGSSSQWRREG